MSDISLYHSAYIVDTFFNDIINTSLENNSKFIIFMDWKNTIVKYNNNGTVLRNDNGYIYNSYNDIIKNINCKGFYVINNSSEDSDDIQNYIDSFNIDTNYIMEMNKIDPKITNDNIEDYNMFYSYILSPKNEFIRYHKIIDSYLNDNYVNINPLIKNKLSIYIITASIYNIIDVLLFSTNSYHIFYFQTNEDEKLFIKKYGKSNVNNVIYCNIFNNTVNSIKSSW
ncbi:unknown similar to AMEV200 [Adoxophyes honmai entomopoxvirus 'L']|uniref:Uncharacterized protein n=1 Tax=Adoxophyes honmai entomopoxvirus 'L' TaxID=1293540 RepID=A0A916NWZ2_9POXV|nr:unknown similar to AMEV200 [Adoxophyes honmai entomopoxvirus 'L']CCU55468.1 unknown similar to AMEV200 [Adoxophyes honmai entomopoxvirus 'L']